MTYYEKMREKREQIKNLYKTSANGKYLVRRKGLNNIVGTYPYKFENLEDAIRYCKDNKALRVVHYMEIDSHTVQEVVDFTN